MRKYYIYTVALLSVLLVSCGGNSFKVKGNVEGGSDTTKMVLESSNNGRWLLVDSVKLSNNGDFTIKHEATGYPDIYRLRYGEKSIYFPIDSIDNVEIKAKLSTFDQDYILSGTDHAVDLMNVDKKAIEISKQSSAKAAESIKAWKDELIKKILSDPGSIVSYYIINKYIGNQPIFDPINDMDLKIIGAVANAYNTFKPTDPRTAYMVDLVINGRRNRIEQKAATDTMYVEEVPLIDIKLQDKHGKEVALSSVAGKGKVVLLNFTAYTAEFSPMFNKILSDAYKQYGSQGLEIYQIGYDPEEFQWRQSAANLPWITVYDPLGSRSRNLMNYNVQQLPTTYVLNKKGEIAERVDDVTRLGSILAKYM